MKKTSKKKARIQGMIEQIDAIIYEALKREKESKDVLSRVHPASAQSARNLVHYRTLRTYDIRSVQRRLGNMGLSRLARSEAHVLASLYAIKHVLQSFLNDKRIKVTRTDLTIKRGDKRLKSNAKALLGFRSKGRRTRIMVTLPSLAAENPALVEGYLASGMNCARINCAHDDEKAWLLMIDNLRAASKKLRKNCKIAMDLGGPKIRTGALMPGPEVVKLVPIRDVRGTVVDPARVWIGPLPHATEHAPHFPVSQGDLAALAKTEQLHLVDLRGKPRMLTITERSDDGFWASTDLTTYVESGTPLVLGDDPSALTIQIGALPAVEEAIVLRVGDTLWLHADPRPGEPAVIEDGRITTQAHIACTAPEVFRDVRPGEEVLFDDGKISGVIREIRDDALGIEISRVRKDESKLRADKGINFPNSRLRLKGLTEKDRRDLAFVARHADVVSLSFVSDAGDVEDLLNEMEKLGANDKLGVILKIENKQAFDNLTEILMAGMRTHPLGIMIARGDLAVECGWENIARVQHEIMSLCQAAHVPDIWATQVLENLVKKGIPSRAEITDAATAQRAECVMLNKGPQILQAIRLLDEILQDMMHYQEKNATMLPAMRKAG